MFHIQQQIYVQQPKIELYIEFEHIIIDEIQHGSDIKDDIAEVYEGMNNNRKEDFKTTYEDKNGDWKDDPPLAPLPLYVACLVEDMDIDDENSDEEYIADNNESSSSEDDDEEEFVLETPVEQSRWYLLPSPHPILALSSVFNHYHTLDLDVMQEKNPFFNTGEDDYNLDGDVEFWVGHRFKSKDAMLQGVKNYSIHRSADKIGGVHMCLAPIMSQNHRQLDNNLICRVILPLIQSSHPSASLSYKVQLGKAITSNPRIESMFDKVVWIFPACVEAFKHSKPFVSVNGMHLYDKYGGVLLIAMTQDGVIILK
ncbi:hypothetical protein Ahy_B04g071473 [Arachis hypogaea]|uniref:Transposase MuDR plant domain-containing protein n=1 Tax=Arachis hypogaea TaxID=3818 RepID=A0A444ZKS8_ARAHY|nr:hypothetical protein Ahy_B04g071473 [Arachis hypogaea]